MFVEIGTLVLSMDALFGLPRKKSAGISYRESLHGDLFFGSQASVDEFVSSSTNEPKTPKVFYLQVIVLTIYSI